MPLGNLYNKLSIFPKKIPKRSIEKSIHNFPPSKIKYPINPGL